MNRMNEKTDCRNKGSRQPVCLVPVELFNLKCVYYLGFRLLQARFVQNRDFPKKAIIFTFYINLLHKKI